MSQPPTSQSSVAQPPVIRRDEDSIARLTLNRPDNRNALSQDMIDSLQRQVDQIAGSTQISVVIIDAKGPAFCAGHDLREMQANRDGAYRDRLMNSCSRFMLSLQQLPQPVIAQVHGVATAAGCQLVASCDLAVAAAGARFATPGVNIGLFCHTPAVALSRAVGRKQAMEMLLTGGLIDADQALASGLINRVVAGDELAAQVNELAQNIASKSAPVIAHGKAVFYQQLAEPVEVAYQIASQAMIENLSHADAEEGIHAFLAKRPPKWSREPEQG